MPHFSRPLRLSRMFRAPVAPASQAIPLRRALLWALVGLAILVGLVLYFRYGRTLTPLVG